MTGMPLLPERPMEQEERPQTGAASQVDHRCKHGLRLDVDMPTSAHTIVLTDHLPPWSAGGPVF